MTSTFPHAHWPTPADARGAGLFGLAATPLSGRRNLGLLICTLGRRGRRVQWYTGEANVGATAAPDADDPASHSLDDRPPARVRVGAGPHATTTVGRGLFGGAHRDRQPNSSKS